MKTVASLDIGTDKVVALVGEVDSYGSVHILGIGETESRGIDRGSVTKLDRAVKAITAAVKEAEDMSGQKITEIVVNISGQSLKSHNERETLSVSPDSTEITEEHIRRLMERLITKGKEDGYEIIHAIPRKYTLDDQEGIEDPVGLEGSKLSAEVHIVKIGTTLSRNILRVVHQAGLKPKFPVVNAIASARAVLKDEEKEDGVLLIDIGSGLTDVVLFLEGFPAVTGSVPIGGFHITKDISHFMKVDSEEAERIKCEYGVAMVELVREEEIIKIRPRGEEREVSVEKRYLAEVIQIRLEEIMDEVEKVIKRAGFRLDMANAGIVITGGTAKLKGIKEFVERYTDLPARIGIPLEIEGLKERLEDPKYSTAIGLLKFASNPESYIPYTSEASEIASRNGKLIDRFIQKVKDFFKEII